MATKLKNVSVMAVALLATLSLLQTSSAQRTHIVGDALGWLVPPNGPSAYSNWAANQTFAVGDILVFNFMSGSHDVAEVTRANFDGCNIRNPIRTVTNSPANITLSAPGMHYFICRFPGHCNGGQKLAVNVRNAASSPSPSPSPQPSAPTPRSAAPTPSTVPAGAPTPTPTPKSTPTSAPTPTPTRSPMTYIVGDDMGWVVPPNNSISYENWTRGKSFMVGDVLVFNYNNGAHNVEEVTKQSYDSCNTNSPISTNSNPPTRITLRTAGQHYYICGIPGHCTSGQKLAVNIGGSGTAMPPSSTATPPSTTESPTGGANPPPEDNAGESHRVAGFSAAFLAFVVGYLLY